MRFRIHRLRSPLNLVVAVALLAAIANIVVIAGGESSSSPANVTKKAVPAKSPADIAQLDHSTWDRLLKQYVRGERIDYLRWKQESRPELQNYLKQLAAVDVSKLSDKAEQLAYYINLYNASMIEAVLDRLTPGYSPSDNNYQVFEAPLVKTGRGPISLNHLEHKIIRVHFDEPRIHAALVCAAVSCPPIIPRAYRAEDLYETLETNMKRFIMDDRRNRVSQGKAYLSEIFKWYAEDFGPGGVVAYVQHYRPSIPSGTPQWIPYDWSLNIVEP